VPFFNFIIKNWEDELEEVTEPVFKRKTIVQIEFQPKDAEGGKS
jgi:hypothetical protein